MTSFTSECTFSSACIHYLVMARLKIKAVFDSGSTLYQTTLCFGGGFQMQLFRMEVNATPLEHILVAHR